MWKENCSKQQIDHLKSGYCERLNQVIYTIVLTIDEKSWGFLNTTIIPPNNVINRTTRIMSFRKSTCGSIIKKGSKIRWILGPKRFLENKCTSSWKIKDFRILPFWCILRNSFTYFGENSWYSQCACTFLLWYFILENKKINKCQKSRAWKKSLDK